MKRVKSRGQNSAQSGDLEIAITNFQEAVELDPSLKINPEKEANKYAAIGLINKGHRLAMDEGKIVDAVKAFDDAQKLDPDIKIFAWEWDTLCWYGSAWGYAEKVLNACEKAVELEPTNGLFREGRGLARALSGNYAGAIEDFTYFVIQEQDSYSAERINARKEWIKQLKADQNPFDQKTLDALRNE